MVKVLFKTNLDLIHADKHCWPETLPERPMVGDIVRSYYKHPSREYLIKDGNGEYRKGSTFDGYQLELKVVSVTLVMDDVEGWGKSRLKSYEVELHLPEHRWKSLKDFYDHYERVTGHKFI